MARFPITQEQHDAIFHGYHSGRNKLSELASKHEQFVLFVENTEKQITVSVIAITTYTSKEVFYDNQTAGPGWISRKKLESMEGLPKVLKLKLEYTHAPIQEMVVRPGPGTYMMDV